VAKASTEKAENNVYALSTWPGFLHKQYDEVQKTTNIDGDVYTPHGIVQVLSRYTQKSEYNHTVMYFVCHRKVYTRSWDRAYSQRFLRTLAHRFAEEIAT
jgi:hypothetical protein